MIRLKIGTETRDISSKFDIDESWINQQINRRCADGMTVCVQVIFDDGDVHLALATPACGGSVGSARSLTKAEWDLVDKWKSRNMDTSEFTGGNLIAFLKQLEYLL